MLVVVSPAHTNIMLAIATKCHLFCCDFQPWLMLLSLARLLRTSGPLVNSARHNYWSFYSTASRARDGQ